MSTFDARRLAKRLGLTEDVICRLQARGYLDRLPVTEEDLDARIYRAHLSFLTPKPQEGDVRGPGR
jgi:hypothetical protein